VVLINETVARKVWPGETPIGQRIHMEAATTPWRTIVGVVADVRHTGLDPQQGFQFYLPATQWAWAENGMILVVRGRGEPAGLTETVERAVWSVDPDIAISSIATGPELIATATAQRRFVMRLFEAFGLAALLLAAAGIYGVLPRSVAERTKEIGIRSALGADWLRILRLVLARGAGLVALGLSLARAARLAWASSCDSCYSRRRTIRRRSQLRSRCWAAWR